jgi:hypothetical protein
VASQRSASASSSHAAAQSALATGGCSTVAHGLPSSSQVSSLPTQSQVPVASISSSSERTSPILVIALSIVDDTRRIDLLMLRLVDTRS